MEDRGAFKVATQNDAPDEARRARYGVLGDTVNYLAQERRMHTVLSKFGMLECFTSLSWGCRDERDESVQERDDVFTTGL